VNLSLRFIVPLAIALGVIAWQVAPLVDGLMLRWFMRDMDIRTALIANTMRDHVFDLVREGRRTEVQRYFADALKDQRLYALAWCTLDGRMLYPTPVFPGDIRCPGLDAPAEPVTWVAEQPGGPVHIALQPVEKDGVVVGRIGIVHDMSFAQRRSEDTRRYLFWLFAAIAAVVSMITIVIAEASFRGWTAGIRRLIGSEGGRSRREGTGRSTAPRELRSIENDLRLMVREIENERTARDEAAVSWTPETLRGVLKSELKGDEILIVSNREPYIHVHGKDGIEVRRPASGLVTALEPVMRACSGTWIAHGSGDADRATVDRHDRVAVPPEHPAYAIRRVWLTPEEEAGYYYGFANEGLWPLCHIAHTRPVFRAGDWAHYRAANQRFAEAVVTEARTRDPIVLVQDYHFALLPQMIRERLPHATIISFWHIPWPNAESFGILPWREEILQGLLGSSILGFHTQYHCNNFFDTVDRFLEARVDRDAFSITHCGKATEVRRYPISIEWPPAALARVPPVAECRAGLRRELGLDAHVQLGIGVDRLDYTKGILERFRAVERLLEAEPRRIGRFTFVQIAAPSRSSIGEYRDFEAQVHAEAARINRRFAGGGAGAIILRAEHHGPESVYRHYRASDVCFVSSLHDGMNLVAKEFIAARDDEQGVLLLSQFAGAARELAEALIVNPYDIEQCAAALASALDMDVEEQRARMRSMRGLVETLNVYRWAGRMLMDAGRMRRRHRVLGGTDARRRDERRAA
jgi:trehalose 6-phosphate synthase